LFFVLLWLMYLCYWGGDAAPTKQMKKTLHNLTLSQFVIGAKPQVMVGLFGL